MFTRVFPLRCVCVSATPLDSIFKILRIKYSSFALRGTITPLLDRFFWAYPQMRNLEPYVTRYYYLQRCATGLLTPIDFHTRLKLRTTFRINRLDVIFLRFIFFVSMLLRWVAPQSFQLSVRLLTLICISDKDTPTRGVMS